MSVLRFFLLIGISIFSGFATSFLQARPLYVSASNGDDANDGRNPTQAFRTIQAAADRTRPGDTVFIDAGIYSSKAKEVVRIRNSGSADQWIVYKNLGPDRPILRIQNEAAIVLQSVSFISIEGLEITRDADWYDRMYLGADPNFVTSTGNGIYAARVLSKTAICHHIKIIDNLIHGCPGTGILINHADHLIINYNQIYDNGDLNLINNSGIRLQFLVASDQAEGNHVLVNGNTIYYQRRNSKLEEDVKYCEKTYSASGISIRDNRYGNHLSGAAPYRHPIQISNNIIHNNGGVAIDILETDLVKVFHNTCFRNNRSPFSNCGEIHILSAAQCQVSNNIFYTNNDKKASDFINYENIELRNNLYYNSVIFIQSDSDRIADPLFVKANNFESVFDFSLKPKSPAIDAGYNLHTTAYDHAGSLRMAGQKVDIGALEYTGKKILPRNFQAATVDPKSIKLFWQVSYSEATGQIIISNHRSRAFSARLYDARGMLVEQQIMDEASIGGVEFDLSHRPAGHYFVVAFNEKETFSGKYFVKN